MTILKHGRVVAPMYITGAISTIHEKRLVLAILNLVHFFSIDTCVSIIPIRDIQTDIISNPINSMNCKVLSLFMHILISKHVNSIQDRNNDEYD